MRWIGTAIFVALAVTGCGSVAHSPRPPALDGAGAAFTMEDVAASAGLRFVHEYGSRSPITIVETMGSGCAFIDYDNDGWPDVFLISAGQDFRGRRQAPRSKLFHNNGNGTFTDVTSRAGVMIDGYAMGCCIGDYDNDGYDDLFVTGFGRNWLLHNNGNGTFTDVTAKSGIAHRPGAWGMGCAFVDVNRDGLLDLYIANYVRYDPSIPFCQTGSTLHGCTPNQYRTQPNELYMNLGGGRFHEKAQALGAADPVGAGLGVTVCDFDGDGWPDIFVANDGTPNALLHNVRGRFEEIGSSAGVAYGEGGEMRAGMGTCAGDLFGDGHPALVVTNFQHEPISIFRNHGEMMFSDVSYPFGVGAPSLNRLKFGVALADLNGDGKLDLYVGNGHVYDNVATFDDSATFEQPDQVYINEGGRLVELSGRAGYYKPAASVTRGVATGDFNNDGATDVLINSLGRPARLIRTRFAKPNHWLGLKLRGVISNRSAIGARVELEMPGGSQVREVQSGGSYLSQHDLRVLFNLPAGVPVSATAVRIRWPSGHVQTWSPHTTDQYVTVEEKP